METIKIKRLEGEEFKLIPTTERFYVSNKGRALKIIKDNHTQVLLEHLCNISKSRNKTGKYYSDIRIEIKGTEKLTAVRLSRAMAKTFLDESLGLSYTNDKRVVDHIDNDSQNNNLENLRILKSNSENIKESRYTQNSDWGKTKIKKMKAINQISGEELEFVSGKRLQEHFEIKNNGTLNGYLNRNLTFKNEWKFVRGE